MIAGSIGVLCLILAGIGFQVLPLNFGAVGLIILSFVLFIIEAYVISYGILTLGGIAALVFGSLFLYRTDNAYLDIELPLIISTTVAIVIYVILIGIVIFKTRGNKGNFFSKANEVGHISAVLEEEDGKFFYQVKVIGEIWKAEADEHFDISEKVNVIHQDHDQMLIKIKKFKI